MVLGHSQPGSASHTTQRCPPPRPPRAYPTGCGACQVADTIASKYLLQYWIPSVTSMDSTRRPRARMNKKCRVCCAAAYAGGQRVNTRGGVNLERFAYALYSGGRGRNHSSAAIPERKRRRSQRSQDGRSARLCLAWAKQFLSGLTSRAPQKYSPSHRTNFAAHTPDTDAAVDRPSESSIVASGAPSRILFSANISEPLRHLHQAVQLIHGFALESTKRKA